MQNFLQILVSGISVGMIYGVIAFGYQLTFAPSQTLNFGQGEALTLGALVGFSTVTLLINMGFGPSAAYLLALPFVFGFGLMQGAVVEVLGVRQAMKTKSEAGWIMATIALGIIFKNLAENIWGKDPLKFPSPLSENPLTIGGVNIRPIEIAIVLGALAMMLAVELFNRR
jgi:branched-chain amino acid transport system permease protein